MTLTVDPIVLYFLLALACCRELIRCLDWSHMKRTTKAPSVEAAHSASRENGGARDRVGGSGAGRRHRAQAPRLATGRLNQAMEDLDRLAAEYPLIEPIGQHIATSKERTVLTPSIHLEE